MRIILYHYSKPTTILYHYTKAKIVLFIILDIELFSIYISIIEFNLRDWRATTHSKNSAFFVMKCL